MLGAINRGYTNQSDVLPVDHAVTGTFTVAPAAAGYQPSAELALKYTAPLAGAHGSPPRMAAGVDRVSWDVPPFPMIREPWHMSPISFEYVHTNEFHTLSSKGRAGSAGEIS